MKDDLQVIADYFADSKMHDFESTINRAIHHIQSLETERDCYREKVVWGYYEDEIPSYYQGKAGENEICEPVTAELVNNMVARITNLEKALDLYQRERDRFKHSKPELTGAYFLTGGHGERDNNLLPEYVTICPAYGAAWSQVYQKTDRTVSYEGS